MGRLLVVIEGLDFNAIEASSFFVVDPQHEVVVGIVKGNLTFRGDITEVTGDEFGVDEDGLVIFKLVLADSDQSSIGEVSAHILSAFIVDKVDHFEFLVVVRKIDAVFGDRMPVE